MFLAITAKTLRLIAAPVIFIGALLLIWSIRQFWLNQPSTRIKQNSDRYRDIAKLNADDDYLFYRVEPHHEYEETVKTATEFNEFDFDVAMLQKIKDETEIFDVAIFATSQNKRTLRLYHDALKYCSPEITEEKAEEIGLSFQQAKREEQRQIRYIMPHPVMETDFSYTIHYYAPDKKQNLTATKVYTLDEIMHLRKKDPCKGPVDTHIKVLRQRGNKPLEAEVDFRYNAEDDFQDY